MIAEVRAPALNILDCIWVTQVRWAGYPPEYTTRLDQLLASVDPIALDYWAAKHLLYPIDDNTEHHPDKYDPLRKHLIKARDVINSKGGIGGHRVSLEESEIEVVSETVN